MGKAILIMNMPETCDECILTQQGFCKAAIPRRFIKATGSRENERQDWCPLKPVPDKMAVEERWFSKEYANGWNACIDEILKGEGKTGNSV